MEKVVSNCMATPSKWIAVFGKVPNGSIFITKHRDILLSACRLSTRPPAVRWRKGNTQRTECSTLKSSHDQRLCVRYQLALWRFIECERPDRQEWTTINYPGGWSGNFSRWNCIGISITLHLTTKKPEYWFTDLLQFYIFISCCWSAWKSASISRNYTGNCGVFDLLLDIQIRTFGRKLPAVWLLEALLTA